MITNDILSKDRFGFITGSAVHVLFPKKSAEVGQRTYAKKLANEVFFQYYDEQSTWQTEHGNMNEYHAANHYTNTYGDLLTFPDFIADKENQIGGSPDAMSVGYGIDFKCPTTLQGWLDYLHEGISDQQYHQCQMYMHLSGCDKWVIAAYLTETLKMIDNGLEYPVKESSRMILIEVGKMEGWAEMILERAPKIISMRNEFIEKLKSQFGDV